MTKEEKQLLLKDLCARLPYGVKGFIDGFGTVHLKGHANFVADDIAIEHNGDVSWIEVNYFKPYLRPMSSMTADEEYEYHQCKNIDYLEICEMKHTKMLETTALCFSHAIDWLNKKGFDYRGLIEKGLAIEAPEGMYKTE